MHCAVLRFRCAARASLRLMYGELTALGRSLGEARRVCELALATRSWATIAPQISLAHYSAHLPSIATLPSSPSTLGKPRRKWN